ncbi:MAG TPA: TlpA disulfide reductase family protein, partial [Niastella sp.]|nr:TlpA disulfide reductase family protein [Niastella sp.]
SNTIRSITAAGILTATSFSVFAQTAFVVQGNLKDTSRNGEKVFLSYYNGEKQVYTSSIVKEGAFTFDGTVKDPARASLSISTSKEQRKAIPWIMSDKCEFFIEGGEVNVQGRFSNAVIKAPGKSHKDFQALQSKLKPFVTKEKESYLAMLNALAARDTVNRNVQTAINERSKQQVDSVEMAFLKANPASHVSLDLLKERVTAKSLARDKDGMLALYNKLSAPLKATVAGKQLGGLIETAFKLGPGKPAEDFVLNDTLGKPVKLSAFKGKYVLLDFWASWCIPCRAENPTVIKAFNKYKHKNFTVISVSLEKPGDRNAWVAAIIKDKLTWTQVAALTKEEGDDIRKQYGIQSIPMNFLIDPQGKIVATYLR